MYTREDFLDVVYTELADDLDNNRANRIIEAADEYVESYVPDTNVGNIINRQQAIDAICFICGKNCDKNKFIYNAPQDEQVIPCPEHYVLSTLLTAQSKIIHCKDCKEYDPIYTDGTGVCGHWNAKTKNNAYCSYAERRKG